MVSTGNLYLLITLLSFVCLGSAYIDISIKVNTSGSDVAYNFPITINQINYQISVSL